MIFSMLVNFNRPSRVWKREINVKWIAAWVFAIFFGHVLAMMAIEKMTFMEGVWLTATTIVTVGYGDLSAKSDLGRLATILLVYVGGVFTLAWVVNEINNRNQDMREKKRRGQWSWNMKNHIVFISPKTGMHDDFIEKVVSELRASGEKRHVILLSAGASDELDPDFERLDIAIVRASRDQFTEQHFADASVSTADLVVIMNCDEANDSAVVIDTLDRIREIAPTATIIAETQAVDRDRAKRLGADQVVRRFRSYPEMLAREIVAPNSAAFIEELFSAGGTTLIPVDCAFSGSWQDCVIHAMTSGVGTPVAYIDACTGDFVQHPDPRNRVSTSRLYVISNDPEHAQARVGHALAA